MQLIQPSTTLFFLCDIQTKFKNFHAYGEVVATANKLVKLAKTFGCEVVVTTQNAKGLGPIDPGIDLSVLGRLHLGTFDKTLFGMLTPDVKAILEARPHITSVVLFGFESHICVLQTVLGLSILSESLGRQIVPYLPLDAISSCNSFEIPVAVSRMREAGAIVTTSESLAFELTVDAASPNFKELSKLVKEEKERTKTAGEILIQGRSSTASSAVLSHM